MRHARKRAAQELVSGLLQMIEVDRPGSAEPFGRFALGCQTTRAPNTHETVLCELVKRAGQADGEDGHVDGEVVLAVAAHVHQLLAVKALLKGLRRGERERREEGGCQLVLLFFP